MFTNDRINFNSAKYSKSFFRHIKEPPKPVEKDVQQLFPPGSNILVYYHPQKPGISVLEPGYSLGPANYFVLVFLFLFLCLFIYGINKIVITQTSATEIPLPSPTFALFHLSQQDGMHMTLIPKGNFMMGGGADVDGQYKHEVYLDAFWMDQTEVTVSMYAACVEAGFCTPPIRNNSFSREHYYDDPLFTNYPVIQVDWFQADAYCQWAGRRLPTEAEWEKAARGSGEYRFPWGDVQDCKYANYWRADEPCAGDPVAVMSYPGGMSPFGIYEMAGNAYEWVADWYDRDYYTISPGENPQGPETGTSRVLRGGSFLHLPQMMYTFSRNNLEPSIADVYTGFRCAQSP